MLTVKETRRELDEKAGNETKEKYAAVVSTSN